MQINQRGFSILQAVIVIGIIGVLIMGVITLKKGWQGGGQKIDQQKIASIASPVPVNMSNPASVYCKDQGGQSVIKHLPNGGEYGVCMFDGDTECEEWAMFRGQCPVGGVKTISYDSPEQIYCAITGGKTTATKNATCTFGDGSVCSDNDYYNGKCKMGDRPKKS